MYPAPRTCHGCDGVMLAAKAMGDLVVFFDWDVGEGQGKSVCLTVMIEEVYLLLRDGTIGTVPCSVVAEHTGGMHVFEEP